jgi:hypothetical protein
MELWIGKSKFVVVDLGDELNLPAISGLLYTQFQEGELVLALRSSGKWTMSQIRTLCPEYVILALGNRLEKQVASTDIPQSIRKLIGSYCLKSPIGVFRNGPHPPIFPAQIGSSNLFPICLGQDCSMLNQCGGFTPSCFHSEELVSYETAGRRVCVAVKVVDQDFITVTDGDRFFQLLNHEVTRNVFKLYDRYLIEAHDSYNWFPSITVGRTKFQSLVLGQDTRCFAQTNGYCAHHFFVGELVSVEQGDSRIAHRFQGVNASGSIVVASSETQFVSERDVNKLEDSFYMIDGNDDRILINVHPYSIQIAQTTAFRLLMGADASSMSRINGCDLFYVGEPVSVVLDDGNQVIGQVTHTGPNESIKVALCEGHEVIVAHNLVKSKIGRLLGCFFLSDQPPLSPPSGVTSSSPASSRHHVCSVPPSHFHGLDFHR